MGSIGDIALEKALPFDGANSGTAPSSADADSVSILTTIDAVVYDWDIATDRLTWSTNVETTLAGFARTALATGADTDEARSRAREAAAAVRPVPGDAAQ